MYTCSVASTANAGESMAKCLLSKLDARGDFEKEIAALKTVLGGSTSATNAQLGQGIIDGAAYQTCNGDDGWRFDPTNHCQEFNDTTMECSVNCEGNDECSWYGSQGHRHDHPRRSHRFTLVCLTRRCLFLPSLPLFPPIPDMDALQ